MGNIWSKLFKKEYVDIDKEELKLMLKEQFKFQFVDVRTKREFSATKISGFTNLDFYQFRVNPSMIEKYKKNKPVVLICATGSRSRVASKLFVKQGFTTVYNYKRGINGYNISK